MHEWAVRAVRPTALLVSTRYAAALATQHARDEQLVAGNSSAVQPAADGTARGCAMQQRRTERKVRETTAEAFFAARYDSR
jgi:hypothetical protein